MEPPVKLTCLMCSKEFERAAKEHRRNMKRGREVFCGLACAMKRNNQLNPRKGNPENFGDSPGRELDEFSPFRWWACRLRAQQKKNPRKIIEVDEAFLAEVWKQQEGRCPLTNWHLILPECVERGFSEKNPHNASLDRIDNSKGYVPGNVRFVARIVNFARSTWSDKEVIEFCEAVVKHKETQVNSLTIKVLDDTRPFRWVIRRCKARSKEIARKTVDIDVSYLLDLWNQQGGICPLTGWTLLFAKPEDNGFKVKDIHNSSLDRIDNSKGYVKGNLRFISVMANYARHTWSDKEVIEFCKAVAEHHKKDKTEENSGPVRVEAQSAEAS